MNISEERLKEIVLRIIQELETEKMSGGERQKVYMLCMAQWDERYPAFLKSMESCSGVQVYPVVPLSWKEKEYESVLRSFRSCRGILYRSCEKPVDYEQTITLFPVVPRNIIVKTALCISDTFETSWLESCMEAGSRIVFLRSGLQKFSGKEAAAYREQILSYYRKILEYGIEIRDGMELIELSQEQTVSTENAEKKRVITMSNIEQYISNGILYLHRDDIVTDLAKDRAKFLNIVFKYIG